MGALGDGALGRLARELRDARRVAAGGAPRRVARPAAVQAPEPPRVELPACLASRALPGLARGARSSPALDPAREAETATRLDALRASHPDWHARLGRLDPAQQAAVVSGARAALVRAQVGSGKTTVLAHRVMHLHLVEGVPLAAMAVLTFTNRAADEIRARLEALAPEAHPWRPDDLWLVGTFHGVARTLLARALPVETLGFSPDFRVLDEDARDALLDEVARASRLRVRRRRRLALRLRDLAAGRDPGGDDLAALAVRYAEEKRARGLMDYDDLIAHATALLRAPFVARAPHPPPRVVLVDELQDCEPRELDFLRRLGGADGRFFGVGDPHQAIYGFRGSGLDVFARVEAEFGCTTHVLPSSYRSSSTILDGARRVLGQQPARGAPLVATRPAGDPIRVRRHHDVTSEAAYLAARVAELGAAGVPARAIAILCRLRSQVEALERALADRGVACAVADDATDDAVRLTTLHASKGLEYRWVFVSGLNAGVMPLGRRGEVDEAEERRLLFVGITRARDGVELSWHGRPEHHAAAGEPSPLLASLPAAPASAAPRQAPIAPVERLAATREPVAPSDPAPAPPSPWPEGAAVRHPRYGVGRVVGVAGGEVACVFGKLGAKSFPLALCPLTRVDG
jgi:superfamily I DNA/RNA helicase